MKTLSKALLAAAAIAFTGMAQGTLITQLEDATNGGGFFAAVSFQNNGANTVTVTADIADPINVGLSKGDILGIWFDLDNFSTLSGQPTFGGSTTVLNYNFSENTVGSSLGANVNLNGSGASNWDLAVEVGQNGNTGGFIQTLSFDVIIAGLNETHFLGQRLGMRVQSIAGASDFDAGSSKLLGVNTVTVPEPGALLLFGLGLFGLGLTRTRTEEKHNKTKNTNNSHCDHKPITAPQTARPADSHAIAA